MNQLSLNYFLKLYSTIIYMNPKNTHLHNILNTKKNVFDHQGFHNVNTSHQQSMEITQKMCLQIN